ncbi:TPA: Tn3 family transposase [Klebsiella pneumoniae]
MSRRHIFTERQRAALFDLPTDELSLLKFYTLGDDDLENIRQRRRPENRIGFALQLCALRYPGRALAPGEMIPREVLSFVGAQLGVPADALLTYATRRQTRQQHMDTLREIYGYKTFTGRGARDLREWTFGQAEDARSNEDLAHRFIVRCRETSTILPAVSTIERLCADALVAAERRIETRIAENLTADVRDHLDKLLSEMLAGNISRFIWLRNFEVGNNSAAANRLLDRLEFLRTLNINHSALASIPAHRIARLRRQGERYFTDHLFGASSLLGYNLVLRIRDLPSKRLYVFNPDTTPRELRKLVGGKAREDLIVANWPDIFRCAATLTAGKIRPSQLLRKLASYPRQNNLAVALREVGRIERTLFIIEWILDTDMQRRAQIGLNKGEAHHALKNALRIGRQGEIRDRTTEGQHYRIAGLNLLTAVIIYWNTVHLGHAVTERRNEGLDVPPEFLPHISPLGWAHILLTGEYLWPKEPKA